MLNWFNMIRSFFPRFWNENMVGDAVRCEKITTAEYKEITGSEYQTETPETKEK